MSYTACKKKLGFGLAKLPRAERLIGFTIPVGDEFYVADHDEVWLVSIGEEIKAEVTDHAPYEFVGERSDFLGLVFEGLTANPPTLRVGETEVSYVFDPTKDFVTVEYDVRGHLGKIEFRTFSGDWFAASLSDSGEHLVLADPYSIELYEVG